MKLYHHPASHNARRVVALVRHLALPVELIEVNLGTGEQRSPEFLALNPNGKVPVLVDGELVLWESAAILAYLATKAESPLAPASPRARADVDRWLAFTMTRLGRVGDVFLFENAIKPFFGMGAPDEAALDKVRPDAASCFAVLEAHLARQDYLAASGLSVADFAAYSIFEQRDAWKLPALPAGGALARWVDRMASLPAWQG
jgi:glutathione S-transferase